MDNQHRQIKGYRELSQAEIDQMNRVKALAAEVGDLVQAFEMMEQPGGFSPDQRWVAIAKADLQMGFMALTRSIAKPTFF